MGCIKYPFNDDSKALVPSKIKNAHRGAWTCNHKVKSLSPSLLKCDVCWQSWVGDLQVCVDSSCSSSILFLKILEGGVTHVVKCLLGSWTTVGLPDHSSLTFFIFFHFEVMVRVDVYFGISCTGLSLVRHRRYRNLCNKMWNQACMLYRLHVFKWWDQKWLMWN